MSSSGKTVHYAMLTEIIDEGLKIDPVILADHPSVA